MVQLRVGGQPEKMARIVLAWAQISAGVGFPLLEHSSRPVPHLEGNWLRCLCLFCGKHGVSLRISDLELPQLQRQHDEFLMEVAIQHEHFTDKQLHNINYCRLCLQVITLSDICTARGDFLAPGVWDCDRDLLPGHTNLAVPHQD